jgi:hypothetical protein
VCGVAFVFLGVGKEKEKTRKDRVESKGERDENKSYFLCKFHLSLLSLSKSPRVALKTKA